ncbi:MAG: hypothetical protein JWR85_1687 [Marmoricola sp.]|nr:hypothetical protein [Marmoricola sp.]
MLRPRLRKSLLIVHIVAGGAWIGIDVVVAALVLTGWLAGDAGTRGLAYQALATFVVTPMLVAGLLCLATGLALGLGTRWGLVRYWWVVVKLVMNVVLCTLIIVLLHPGMAEVGEHGRALSAGLPAPGDMSGLIFPPAVSLTALVIATVLSVFKPWGRTGRRA